MIDKAAFLEEFKQIRKLLIQSPIPTIYLLCRMIDIKIMFRLAIRPCWAILFMASPRCPNHNQHSLQILTMSLSQISFTILIHHYLRLCSENSSRRNHDQRNYALVAKASKQSFICSRTFENIASIFCLKLKLVAQSHPQ